ncbi:ABC transporter ATP-binding protein [Halorubrum sp. SP3]|uniref:ABC transporter ATP-binding protein n=1 Tax=unclassified Halorubrum TaxID=2642239 RepID=UPI0010F92912|nr:MULTISPECIES: ABC transporter ATP-binding protein [unclassified Halorubrum]TKX53732.1 ABC transporter ATP-binding protein [Halorubrum sp. SP3]TKX69398.1 ABC transporter ATP-binding protein [Halorubrum sp. SP9]
MTEPLLSVRDLEKHYPIRKGIFNRQVGAARAVDGISFDIAEGETLGLVGESGCGKSTAASSVIHLEEPTSGEVIFNGNGREGATRNSDGTHPNDVTKFDDDELMEFRRGAQMIFQDPSSSFDPRMSVGNAVGELLKVHGMNDRHRRRAIVEDLLERVGLSASDFDRYPHEFSGGQKQRIALARALVLNPDLIIADEPVSALDVSIQAEILSLINDLQEEFGLSLLFISHDMSVIRQVCDRVAVMYLGEIVEIGPVEEIFTNPQHPYTEALLSSIPTPDPRSKVGGIELKGTVPSPTNPPSGCRFHTRCHKVIQPEGVDIDQEDWRGLLNLRDNVAAGEVDVEQIRENLAAGGTEPTESAVSEEIRHEFDIGETVDDPDLERTLSEAIEHLFEDDAERAGEVLADAIRTPCAETVPERTVHAPDHESACLRHGERVPAEPNPADD